MYEPGGAPRQWTVPAQRSAPPPTLPRSTSAPETAARSGHHDWGAMVAALAALLALGALLGVGASVAGHDGWPASVISTR